MYTENGNHMHPGPLSRSTGEFISNDVLGGCEAKTTHPLANHPLLLCARSGRSFASKERALQCQRRLRWIRSTSKQAVNVPAAAAGLPTNREWLRVERVLRSWNSSVCARNAVPLRSERRGTQLVAEIPSRKWWKRLCLGRKE